MTQQHQQQHVCCSISQERGRFEVWMSSPKNKLLIYQIQHNQQNKLSFLPRHAEISSTKKGYSYEHLILIFNQIFFARFVEFFCAESQTFHRSSSKVLRFWICFCLIDRRTSKTQTRVFFVVSQKYRILLLFQMNKLFHPTGNRF